jgi:hypothetical protein
MKKIFGFVIVVIVIIAGAALFSSDLPDGLDSFIGNRGLHRFSGIHVSPFIDYQIPIFKDRNWGTFISGLIGTFLCAGFFLFFRFLFARLTKLHKQD